MKKIEAVYTVISAHHSYHGHTVATLQVLGLGGSPRQITVEFDDSPEANVLAGGDQVKVSIELPEVPVKAESAKVEVPPETAKPKAKKAPQKPKAKKAAAPAPPATGNQPA